MQILDNRNLAIYQTADLLNQVARIRRNWQPRGRIVQPGINWTWYMTDSEADARAWFQEVTGSEVKYSWIITKLERENKWGFSLHH